MQIDPETRIGADGKRHPAGDQPTDSDAYQRRRITVVGARGEDDNAIVPGAGGTWVWGEVTLP